MRIHKRLLALDILETTPKTVDALMRLDLPAGVDCQNYVTVVGEMIVLHSDGLEITPKQFAGLPIFKEESERNGYWNYWPQSRYDTNF